MLNEKEMRQLGKALFHMASPTVGPNGPGFSISRGSVFSLLNEYGEKPMPFKLDPENKQMIEMG